MRSHQERLTLWLSRGLTMGIATSALVGCGIVGRTSAPHRTTPHSPQPLVTAHAQWRAATRPGKGIERALYAGDTVADGKADEFSLPPLPLKPQNLSLTISTSNGFQTVAPVSSLNNGCQANTVYVSLTHQTLRFCTPPPAKTIIRVVYYPSSQYVSNRCGSLPAKAQSRCMKTPLKPSSS